MDRNTLTGFLLIGLILVTFNVFFQPKEQPSAPSLPKKTEQKAELAPKNQESVNEGIKDSLIKRQYGVFSSFATGSEKTATLENANIRVEFTNKGGHIHNVVLKSFKTYSGTNLGLFRNTGAAISYGYVAENRPIETADLFFQIDSSKSTKTRLVYYLEPQNGSRIEHIFELPEKGYDLQHSVKVVNMEGILAPNIDYTRAHWNVATPRQEKDLKDERNTSTIYYHFLQDDAEKISYTDYKTEDLKTAVKWVSFKQKFFNATLVADKSFEEGKVSTILPSNDSTVKEMKAELTLPLNIRSTENKMKFYFGPNDYATLKAYGIGLEEMIPLGWGIFGWVNKLIVINVFDLLDDSGIGYGWVILILTILIKLILFPFTYKSYMSSAKMRILKPEIDDLKEKYGNDPTRQQAEQMKLFQRAGVNPLGGCLPLLLQLPILIAMFNFFPASIELRQQPFLWAADLSTYDSVWNFGKVPLISTIYGDHVSLFALLMTASTLLYTHFNNQITGVTGQMKWIGYIMPLMFLGIMNNYSAGLSYYYLMANLITFGQQWMIRRFVDEDKIHAQIQENKKKPAKKSKWAARLEEIAKAQQEQAKARQKK